jgi:hypothetical protein
MPKRKAPNDSANAPELWAKTRRGLCETLPYFRSWQGALYSKNLVVFGYLIDAEVEPRDYFDSQVVITSVYVWSIAPIRPLLIQPA